MVKPYKNSIPSKVIVISVKIGRRMASLEPFETFARGAVRARRSALRALMLVTTDVRMIMHHCTKVGEDRPKKNGFSRAI